MERSKAKKVAVLGVLTALVVLLQCFGGLFQVAGLSLSFVLVPIVLAACIYGFWSSVALGFIFSLVVFAYGFGGEAFTTFLMSNYPVGATLIIFVKGVAAGAAVGGVYGILKKKNEYVAVVCAALTAPIVNTGLFMLGVWILGDTVLQMLGIGVLFNFLIEVGINIVLAPALYRVIKAVKL